MRFVGNIFVLICFLILLTPDCSNAFSREQHQKDTSLDLAGKSSLAIALQPFASATLDEVNLTESRFPVVRGERIELINIAQEIGKNRRKDFGFALLGTRKRKIIEEITREDSSTANKVIILEWLLGKGKTPVTSRVLVDALREIGMNELADEITLTCEALNILDLVYMPTSIKEYSQKLSKRYQSESIMNTTQWLPRMFKGRNISIEYVDLTLKENGNTITLSNIINDMQSGMRILFLGRPGVGKTTLTRHLSRVWTKTDSDQFYLVVKVHLGVAGKIDNLDSLINASIQRVEDIEVISEYISATQGRGVCILLDGFDEYVYDSTDYVSNLIHGYSLSEAVVILTSRPAPAEIIESSFPRKIEIIGFGDSGIKMYLDQLKLSQDENQTITEYFQNHPTIKQLCYLPLHLSMLVYIAVVKADPNILSLVKTETELYSSFLTQTITQYQNVRQELRAKSFMKCFDNRYNDNDSCFLFWTICEHAFSGVMSREQKFDSSSFDDLPESEYDEILKQIESLSLFKVEKNYDENGYEIFEYYYSHPTYQEYLAALHITTLPFSEQLSYIRFSWMQETYKFFLGLVGRKLTKKYDDKAVFQTFVKYSREVLATYQEKEIYVMKCAHEVSRQHISFVDLLKSVDIISKNNSVSLPVNYVHHDCWYIGYLLAQSSLNKLTVNKYTELASCLAYITDYLRHSQSDVNVTELALGDDRSEHWAWFTEKEDLNNVPEILKLLSTFQKKLTDVRVLFLRIGNSSSVLQLGDTINLFQNLTHIALSVNTSVIKDGHLVNALQHLTNLKHLELGVINKHDDDTSIPDNLFDGLKDLEQLETLTLCISWNKDIVDVNTTALIGGLKSLSSLNNLSLHFLMYNGLRKNGGTELLHGLKMLSISELNLFLDLCWNNGIGDITVKELSTVLKKLSNLLVRKLSLCIDFNLSGIPGLSGPRDLIEGLRGLTELQHLHLELRWELQENDNIDEACIAFAEGLKSISKLKVLELDFSQNGSINCQIKTLLESLNQVEELSLKWRSSKDKTDVTDLFNGLKHLKKLRKLDLSWNTINDHDVISLIESLKGINKLNILDLSHNEIGDEGVQILADAIDSHQFNHLEAIYLDNNKLSQAGAKYLSLKITQLSKLRIFDLGLDLGSYSAQALSEIQLSSVPVKESSNNFVTIASFLKPALLVTVLVGSLGILFYCVIKPIPRLSVASSDKQKPLPMKTISESLAQGIFSTSYAWNLEKLRKRFPELDGSGTVIAILDTAIDITLPAFKKKFEQNQITVIDFLQGLPVSSCEHGSVCATVAVGLSYSYDQTTDIPSGVAPGAHLIVYRIAENGVSYIDSVLRALNDIRIKTESGIHVDVVSISYDLEDDKIDELRNEIDLLASKGVVFVAAAGNRGEYQPHSSIPAYFDNVISVGALDKNGRPSDFTSSGRVDVYAPGENIPSPSLPSGEFKGTSFATPAISGLVALLKQHAKSIGPPASLHIHEVQLLKRIFDEHMKTRSYYGKLIFAPVEFLLQLKEDHNLINRIVEDVHERMEH